MISNSMLFNLLTDLTLIDDTLLIVKNDAVISEIRGASFNVKQNKKWITIGENDDPAHLHINSELIKSAEFIEEEKPERTSFSVRFFDEDNKRILAVFLTKMYDSSNSLISERKKIFEDLKRRYSTKIKF